MDEALAAGVEGVLLTGGEPLLSADLWPVAERLRAGGVRLLAGHERHAAGALRGRVVARLFHEVYVSLDGASAADPRRPARRAGLRRAWRPAWPLCAPPRPGARGRPHHAARRQPATSSRGWWHRARAGPRPRLLPSARRVVLRLRRRSRRRARPGPGRPSRCGLRAAVVTARGRGRFADGFILESAAKLRRLARHLEASAGRRAFERPRLRRAVLVERGGGRRRGCAPVSSTSPWVTRGRGCRALAPSPAYRAALRRIRGAERRPATAASARSSAGWGSERRWREPARRPVVLYNPRGEGHILPLALVHVGSCCPSGAWRSWTAGWSWRPRRGSASWCATRVCLGVSVFTGVPIRDAVRVTAAARAVRPDLPVIWGAGIRRCCRSSAWPRAWSTSA